MKESQKYIYYACGETVDKIGLLPQTELLRDQGYEILYLTDDVDEFASRCFTVSRKNSSSPYRTRILGWRTRPNRRKQKAK